MIERVHDSIYVDRLWRLCRAWGGELKFVSETRYETLFMGETSLREGWADSPFIDWHGVNFERKEIYVVPDRACAGAIIHEMGHVFATAQPPGIADEYPWLGWEICVARMVGCYRKWSDQNAHYGISEHGTSEWGDASPNQKKLIIRDRIKHGQSIGIIDSEERPLTVR